MFSKGRDCTAVIILGRYYHFLPVQKKVLRTGLNFTSVLFPCICYEELCFSIFLKKTLDLLLIIVKSLCQVDKFQKAIWCLSQATTQFRQLRENHKDN